MRTKTIISSDEFDEEENDHYLAISGTSAASGDSQDSNEDIQLGSDDDGDVLMSENSSDNEQPPRKKPRSAKTSKHRKTGLDERWEKSFKWLDTLVGQGKVGMICKVCQKQSSVPRSKKKVWISEPCFQLRVDKIKQHEKSPLHRQSLLVEANRSSSVLTRAFREGFSREAKAAIGCCTCLYWLCKQEISHTTTYPSLIALAKNLGCEYFKALNVGRNAKYTSPQIIADFLEIMDSQVAKSVLKDMKTSGVFSLMIDESTDVSVLKQLVLYGRTVAEGKLKTRFLKIVYIEDGRAATILEAITKFFEASELEFNNLSSFGSDGASVMTGHQGGVATLLCSKCSPHFISIHCVCHRLALASGQASNNVPYLKQMKDHLIALWKYFHFSPVRSANLKSIQDVMNSPELKPVKAVDTHWLSHKAAVVTLLRCLPAVLVMLQQAVNPTAVGLRTVMARYNFFASLLLLNDVLSAINRLSLIFQYSTIDFTIVPPLLNSTIIESLKKMQHASAAEFEDNVKQLTTHTTTDMQSLHQCTDIQSEVSSSPSSQDPVSSTEILNDLVTIRAGEPENFEVNVRQKFLREIIKNIEERFPQVEILEAFSIFDPSGLLPHKEITSKKLEILLEHYDRNLDLQTESNRERCKKKY